MRVKAFDRFLIVRMDTESIERVSAGGIVFAKETIQKEEEGVGVATVLDIGKMAFDTHHKEDDELVHIGRKILTGRYPGKTLPGPSDISDGELAKYRLISCDEILGLIPTDSEDFGCEIIHERPKGHDKKGHNNG